MAPDTTPANENLAVDGRELERCPTVWALAAGVPHAL
jgi:hypothetical protein